MRKVNALLTVAAHTGWMAVICAAIKGFFSPACSSVHKLLISLTREANAMKKAKILCVGLLGVLILALLVAFSIGTAYAQGAGKALDFDGTDDYVNIPGLEPDIEDDVQGTIEAWIKKDVDNVGMVIFAHTNLTNEDQYIFFYIENDNKLYFIFRRKSGTWGNDYVRVIGNTVINAGTWYHVAVVSNGTAYKLYVNGQEESLTINGVNNGRWFNDMFPGDDDSFIGKFARYKGGLQESGFFDGTIDEVRIWNVARPQTQIQDNMHKTDISSSNLEGYWKLNDGTGSSTAADASVNGNTGTLTDMDTSTAWVTSTAPIGDYSNAKFASPWNITDKTGSPDYVYVSFPSDPPDGGVIAAITNAQTPNATSFPSGKSGWNISQRYWQLWASGAGSYSATVRFYYANHPGINTETKAQLNIWKRTDANSAWTDVTNSATLNDTDDYFELTVSSFSQYAIGGGSDNPLPVELSSFTATASDGEVTLHWRTESEIDNLGFNIYRALEPEGQYIRINPELIRGAGTSPSGHDYFFTDTRLTNGVTYWYKLEDVDLDGTKTMHGPIFATPYAVGEESVDLPGEYGLSQSYPNPFNPGTVIEYRLPEDGFVLLRVYDALGHPVRTLVDGEQDAGYKSTWWDGKDDAGGVLGSGVYFCRLEVGGRFVGVRKMVIMR